MALPPEIDESVTLLLRKLAAGQSEAGAQLIRILYTDLRRMAAAAMRRERPNHSLQPTELLNEAWMRLAQEPGGNWKNRAHFLGVASTVMRQILVDHARRRKAGKRGGGAAPVTLEDRLIGNDGDPLDILAVHNAVERLSALSERAARVVEMHFFGGMSFGEMAEVLEVAQRTVTRDWTMAREFLRREFAGQRR